MTVENFCPERIWSATFLGSIDFAASAAVQIIKQAAEAAKSVDPKKVADQMRSGQKFSTVIGDITYDKKGDITRLDYVMYVWKKNAQGKITYEEIEEK